MTDDTPHPTLYNLSRRRILGGLGAIGLASAGAGLGTSAFFSDEETFEANTLVAGSLDMKVDWEEHYSDWSPDEAEGLEGPEEGPPVVMIRGTDPGEIPPGYVGLPDPENPLIAVYEGDLDQFMANTAIEAFPDVDDDGSQDSWAEGFEYYPCDMGADTPEDLDPMVEGALRTLNDDTYDAETESPKPLVALDDVKPGDFGELTLSFHLCDNPGYVWLQGALVDASENGITEPEGKDPQEQEGIVELLEAVRTVWWYDAGGDNVLRTGCEEELYLTDSGTDPTTLYSVNLVDDGDGARAELTQLWPNGDTNEGDFDQTDAIAATADGNHIFFYDKNSPHLGRYDVDDDSFVDLGAVSGDPGAVVLAGFSPDGTLWAASQNTDSLYTVEMSPSPAVTERGDTGINLQGADLAFSADGTMYIWTADSGDQGLYKVDDPWLDTTAVPVDASSIGTHDATMTGLAIRNAGTGDIVASDRKNNDIVIVDRVDGSINERYPMVLGGEPYVYDYGDMTAGQLCGEVFHRGTLGSDLAVLGDGLGIPLDGNRATPFDEIEDDPASPARECFVPGVPHYIGFAWYLPVDHANEIQTDSVTFDLGFYTEQCRHNDGSGQPPEDLE